MEKADSHKTLLVKSTSEATQQSSSDYDDLSLQALLHTKQSDSVNESVIGSFNAPKFFIGDGEETSSASHLSHSTAMISAANSEEPLDLEESLNRQAQPNRNLCDIESIDHPLKSDYSALPVDQSGVLMSESQNELLVEQSDNDPKTHDQSDNKGNEKSGYQVFFALMLAAMGNFAAGIILDHTKTWEVFLYTPELYYLVPILLSLKGNLEMTMVARLSTLANMGLLSDFRYVFDITLSNIYLVQTQAIIVSFLASIVTIIALKMEGQMASVSDDLSATMMIMANQNQSELINDTIKQMAHNNTDGSSLIRKCLQIFATSLATANLACIISTIGMIAVLVLMHRKNINPDNYATALAASVGDLLTSVLVAATGNFIFHHIAWVSDSSGDELFEVKHYAGDLRSPMLALLIILFFIIILPFLAYLTCKNSSNKAVLIGLDAWVPILVSMLIAFVSGFVLRFGAVQFSHMPLFQPLINGIGGNLAAISTSHYSTALHVEASKTELNNKVGEDSDKKAKEAYAKRLAKRTRTPEQKEMKFSTVMTRTLNTFFVPDDPRNKKMVSYFSVSIFVHFFYGLLAPHYNGFKKNSITVLFYFFYIPSTLLQVILLLIMTRFFVDLVWWLGFDPDTSAIPILTAIGDFLGTVFLYVDFLVLKALNDPSALPLIHSAGNDELFNSTLNIINQNVSTALSMTVEALTTKSSPLSNNLTTFSFINYTTTALP